MKFYKNHFLETVRQHLFVKEKDNRLLATFAAGTVLYFLAVSAVAGLGMDARFRNPVNAFIIMFAAYSLTEIHAFGLRANSR